MFCGCGRLSVISSRCLSTSWRNNNHIRLPPVRIISRQLYRGDDPRIAVVSSLSNADSFVSTLSPRERRFLQEALRIHQDGESQSDEEEQVKPPTVKQVRLAGFHSAIPFIGFGLLDNAIMIIAGEYIDYTIGAAFGISTMAAAALGNIVSDVSGISLAHYVQLASNKLGFQGPGLSSKQMEMPRTTFSINLGRAIGISIGCVLGMFPLFFLSRRDKDNKDQKLSNDN